jgi:hypothetical protein
MKNLFFLALIALLTTSCQINVMQSDPSTDPNAVVPDANARIARKLFVGGADGKTVYSEDRYEYNQQGQLTKLSRLSRNAAGNMDLYGYNEYVYNELNQPTQMRMFSRTQSGFFEQQWVTNYEHPTPNQEIETMSYVDATTKVLTPQSRIETTTEQGRKARVIQYYRNNQTFEKSRETLYRYEAGRLTAEENLNANGAAGTVLRYAYKGRTATVEEFMGNRSESISSQAFQYDSKGRLIRSEVTKTNPVLCVAMVSGSATVYEYVD